MLYEMWFLFSTESERVKVIQDLRDETITISQSIENEPQFKNQVILSPIILYKQ